MHFPHWIYILFAVFSPVSDHTDLTDVATLCIVKCNNYYFSDRVGGIYVCWDGYVKHNKFFLEVESEAGTCIRCVRNLSFSFHLKFGVSNFRLIQQSFIPF